MNESPSSALLAVRRYLSVVQRQWQLLLLVLALGIGGAVAYVELKPPVYASSMKIVVGQGRTVLGPDVSGSVQPLTQTMTSLLQSDVVSRRVIDDLKLRTTPEQMVDHLDVTTRPDTAVLEVRFEDTDRARSSQVLARLGIVFTRLVNRQLGRQVPLVRRRASSDQATPEPLRATVFDPAHALPGQVWPRPVLTLAVATVLGLGAGFLLAILRDALMSRIRNDEEAGDAFQAPVIGGLPRGTLGTTIEQLWSLPPALSARMSESMQLLAASIRFSSRRPEEGVVVVASARPEDGKTTLVGQLSSTLANAGRRVVAVEADLRRPALMRCFGVPAGKDGLSDVIAGEVLLDDALVEVEVEPAPVSVAHGGRRATRKGAPERKRERAPEADERGQLIVLGAGRRRVNPTRTLSLTSLASLVQELRERADYVIFDTPPVLLSGDAFPLAQLADTVVVACREGATSRDEARSLRRTLGSLEVHDFLVVLTESSAAEQRAYGYEYG